ncbi:MAG: SpoIIE family protein phosphatase [Desulfobacterales bacterium]|nr:MAG: SpoIIE family protein phosphatase [Desulfobacterales bacterium]
MSKSLSRSPSLIGLYLRNFTANISGNLIIILLNIFTPLEVFKDWQTFLRQEGGWVLLLFLFPTIFITAIVLQYLIQRPISTLFKQIYYGNKVEPELQEKARRRLLNLHIYLGLANLTLWVVLTALFIPVLHYIRDIGVVTCLYIFFRGVIIGLMASFIAFFLIDDYSRKKLIPILFPGGRLAFMPGTIRVSILRRIRILYGAGTGAPMLVLVGTLALILWEMDDSVTSSGEFGKEIFIFIIVLYCIFVAIALSLNFLVGKSILNPIKEMMGVVKKVRHGNFNQKVRVISNDELGVLGDGMNEMTEGLIERDRMRESLNLAKEVQQALLPRVAPKIEGLDIAAHIIYCDETGGDYYDFFGLDDGDQKKVSVVVGDVSGHGVPSALLMASARAFFRQRSALPGTISRIVSDVNRQLVNDVQESGGFMTLFYLTVDLKNNCLIWVRAGHDPAILYDPESDTFEELRGSGIALGIDGNHEYEEYDRKDLAKGQIIVLGTDGIWEAENSNSQRFGKEPLLRIIRQYSESDATGLLTACLYRLEKFQNGLKPEDDVTLIVIKITNV